VTIVLSDAYNLNYANVITNSMERIMREIRRCTRVVDAFSDGHPVLMLVQLGLGTWHRANGKR